MAALPRKQSLASRRHFLLSELATEAFILPPKDTVPVFHDLVLKVCRAAGFVGALQGAVLRNLQRGGVSNTQLNVHRKR